jgi:hypothetical protein
MIDGSHSIIRLPAKARLHFRPQEAGNVIRPLVPPLWPEQKLSGLTSPTHLELHDRCQAIWWCVARLEIEYPCSKFPRRITCPQTFPMRLSYRISTTFKYLGLTKKNPTPYDVFLLSEAAIPEANVFLDPVSVR